VSERGFEWVHGPAYQIYAGIISGIGGVGIVRAGADRWIGLGLLLAGALLALRGIYLSDQLRAREGEALRAELREAVTSASQAREPSPANPGGLRGWLRRWGS
jgi:hypothetical protein